MKKFIVRAHDDDYEFREKEVFDSFEEATEWADKMSGVFGYWNTEIYEDAGL